MDLSIDAKTGHFRQLLEENFKMQGFSLNRQGKREECLEERMHKCKQILVQRREDVEKQRLQNNDGTCPKRLLLRKRKLAL